MRHHERRLGLIAAVFTTVLCWTHALTTGLSHKHTSSVTRQPSARFAVLIEEDEINGGGVRVNGALRNDEESSQNDGYLSPYHVLYPDSFADSPAPLKRQLPLHSCLRLLRKTLEAIIADDTPIRSIKSKVLRIEHSISHVVDPLCWLQAQTTKRMKINNPHPSLYFATVEDTLETAIFGSVKTHTGTVEDEEFWQLVDELPPSTNLYGGQRFDVQAEIAEEWKEFSQGLWMLPAVEIRREQRSEDKNKASKTTIAVHLYKDDNNNVGFSHSAKHVLAILTRIDAASTPAVPPTTLPPVLSRTSTYGNSVDGQELYERGVAAALAEFEKPESTLQKVVLARRMDLKFGRHASDNVHALDVLRKWKFASKPGGHMFYIHPGNDGGEFFGCAPERLFQVQNGRVLSEALAGTRPRGSTQEADEELSRQLFASTKDQSENVITGNFIRTAFEEMQERGWVESELDSTTDDAKTMSGHFFVRRLRHLQHICQRFQCFLPDSKKASDVIKYLLTSLHPTPAVGGFPMRDAVEFIRKYETTGFDRGFYSGPVGFVSRDSAEIVVAIRSGLLSRKGERPIVSVYAGAGIVPGSKVQEEWTETSYKLAVVSSTFPQSPITLQSATSPNAAWATAFIEELVRNGVTQFYICPGSRSTPLVAAIAKAVRSNVGVVRALSMHDERGAAFRAVGYARGSGNPAAVLTSSGTAIANLYPAIIEAGMDGVPLLILTADRPYESRDTGANQAIDQVKAFSSTYVRWFRDFSPPTDDVPVAVALADAAHSVSMSRELRGPVHLNIQFRENLAPDGGRIRNDDRAGSVTKYDALRFTEAPGFQRWSLGGGKWLQSFTESVHHDSVYSSAVADIVGLIMQSKRGIIVVGNLRKLSGDKQSEDISQTIKSLSSFAQSIGFPIFASALSGSLRFESPSVVPFAEHLLRFPLIQENLEPDLILQFGAPMISTEIPKIIKDTMSENPVHHVIVHPHHPHERADPEFTLTHKVNAEIGPFISALASHLEELPEPSPSSCLAPLVGLGRRLQSEMPSLVESVVEEMKESDSDFKGLTEPEIFLALSRILSDCGTPELSLFLSNSMPVRDAEAFLYPLSEHSFDSGQKPTLMDTGVNRGASGIDGIIASAAGFADSTDRPTTLVIGDVAALHDINSLHALRTVTTPQEAQAQRIHPLTTIVLNNDGGGIFSFLPIAKHGNDVSFEDFFATPTNTFSFEKGAAAFDLPFHRVENVDSLVEIYRKAIMSEKSSIIEAVVAPRDRNVLIHKEITRRANEFLATVVNDNELRIAEAEKLPIKHFAQESFEPGMQSWSTEKKTKCLVLLHGWMGDKSEWDSVGSRLAQSLPPEWTILSIDLPGHGESMLHLSSHIQSIHSALGLNDEKEDIVASNLGIDQMCLSVFRTLRENGIDSVDAIAGYSLGGRVALAMKRMGVFAPGTGNQKVADLVTGDTKLVLISAYPGEIMGAQNELNVSMQHARKDRLRKDEELASEIMDISNREFLTTGSDEESALVWSDFLRRWYGAPLWGSLSDQSLLYGNLIKKRSRSLSRRGQDFAAVLRQCSPPVCSSDDWRVALPERTLFVCGSLDQKYSSIGRDWVSTTPSLNFREIPEKGHALLIEAPEEVAESLRNFLLTDNVGKTKHQSNGEKQGPIPAAASTTSQKVPSAEMATEGLFPTDGYVVDPHLSGDLGSLDFERFTIGLVDERRKQAGVLGIGWGASAEPRERSAVKERSGFIIQLMSSDGSSIGLGEVSPLSGLHQESLQDAEDQLNLVAGNLADLDPARVPSFDAKKILAVDGGIDEYLKLFSEILGVGRLLPSVRSGIEMALLSLASQVVRAPIHQALVESSPWRSKAIKVSSLLPLNGLITRGSAPTQVYFDQKGETVHRTYYESWKVKIGHQSAYNDAMAISYAFQLVKSTNQNDMGRIRADANRGFNETSANEFSSFLKRIDRHAFQRLEYVEEPLEKRQSDAVWSLANQVDDLERWYKRTSIPYALDESLSDLAEIYQYDFDLMMRDLRIVFPNARGCAAFVFKPSILGLELSLRLARSARQELGIGAVFTSSFDSGVGLSYISFLASLSDASPAKEDVKLFSHGLGTFSMLAEDCLSPSFGSYVNQQGVLKVASLSRAFYGLGLDEIDMLHPPQLSMLDKPSVGNEEESAVTPDSVSDEFEASTATSSNGREISVLASLPLPFSAEIACARFSDLPQQPRWSPWINSVAYLDAGSETEWTLRVRGVSFRWRAISSLLEAPFKGIRWESVSGLKNTGVVEFIPIEDGSCVMKVHIILVTPRILAALFEGTSVFFEDFFRNKILKWSLEMFRDVVKGDLALEEGNAELGDALFGVVEGKASEIEATLANPMGKGSTR